MSQTIEINLDKDGIWINGVFSPAMTTTFLKSTLGEPRVIEKEYEGKEYWTLMWDNEGIVAYTEKGDKESISSLYLYPCLSGETKRWDTPEADFSGVLSLAKKPFMEKIPHKKLAEAYLYIENVKIGDWKIEAEISNELHEKINTYDIKYKVAHPDEISELVRNFTHPFGAISINFEPKRISSGKYNHKALDDKILSFDNFNFKLAIIQELMYNKGLIEPKFDVHDFAKDYVKRDINVNDEGYAPIREVKKWFETLTISATLAENVEELYLDGGNEVYGQIIPFWDGEDSYYDIKDITPEELVQFPKLKLVNVEAFGIGKKAKAVLIAAGVEVKE